MGSQDLLHAREVAATFYSLIETAKLQSIDPSAYLLEAARGDERGEVLLPSQFAEAQIAAE